MNQKGIATFMKAERGFAHLVLIITTLLLLAGIGIAVYLTQFTQIFKPYASETTQTALLPDKEIWITPNLFSESDHAQRLNPIDLNQFFTSEEQLTKLLINIDVVNFFAVTLYTNPVWLNDAVALLKKNNIKISVEAGGLLAYTSLYGVPACDGKKSAELELPAINRVYAQGGKVDYLQLDEVISSGIFPNRGCNLTIEKTAQELSIYIRTIHQSHPEIKIGITVSPPGWMWKGEPLYWGPNPAIPDLSSSLPSFIEALRSKGEDIHFIHLDNPYDFAMGTFPDVNPNDNFNPSSINWFNRMLDVEQTANKYNIRFGIMSNSQIGGESKIDTGKTFYDHVLSYIDEYKERGGNPKDYMIESWYTNPRTLLPDNDPNTFTFMDLVRDTIHKVDTAPTGVLDGVFNNQLIGWACDIDKSSTARYVHLYIDDQYVTFVKAENPGEDQIAPNCGGYKNRRFSIDIPNQYKDGKSHTVKVWAINNTFNGTNFLTEGSPKTFNLPAPKVGDLNPPAGGDGNVDMADFNIFARLYKDKDLRADFNGNGGVDLADLNLLIRNFGH